ncbi:endonuclease/exonuclease/phosphatase family protein [Methylonatrum kenyense]|uniref:endonuclease/exonuclease/phosphatase family protein n=1 Tax=Methylonatrum kenyense TaxID=455253 RepID=UPI0020BDAF5F|nr:endonuclease/exonuclease/phosphatase family protein [Methylonatrum kenyense]MCK8514992.1 endonuclease/exonuclease/phosphatase family protein [Methylonatrum kenyense]
MNAVTRIISWNCNNQLGRKLSKLSELKPDVAVVQECERDLDVPEGFTFHWRGDNPRKGLGVLCRDSKSRVCGLESPAWTYFLPIELPGLNLRLLAVWAFNFRAQKFGDARTGNAREVIVELSDWLGAGPSLVVGDFNNNLKWDTARGQYNFADIVKTCSALGMRSVYHSDTGDAFGEEQQPTFLHTKNPEKPFHIDYCFVGDQLSVQGFRVEPFHHWLTDSDHVPLILEVDAV